MNNDEITKLAIKLRKPKEEIAKTHDYLKRNPFDHIQKSDPRYEKVWGKKEREREDKIKKKKTDAELEKIDRMEFENRKKVTIAKGLVHKNLFVPSNFNVKK